MPLNPVKSKSLNVRSTVEFATVSVPALILKLIPVASVAPDEIVGAWIDRVPVEPEYVQSKTGSPVTVRPVAVVRDKTV